MNLAHNKILFINARIVQIIVAVVFIIAATLKGFDPQAFAEQITQYNIFPHLAVLAAWCFIVGEFMLAFALIVNLFPKVILPAAILLLLFFIAITYYSMTTNIGGNCGCFGNLVHRSPEQVIVEDAAMLRGMVFSALVLFQTPQRKIATKLAVVILSGVLIATTSAYSSLLPVDSFVTQLKVGATFTSWPVEGLYKDLNKGTHVVFLFSVKEKTIETDVSMMNAISQNENIHSSVGLITDGSSHLTELVFQYGTAFQSGALEPRFARSLYRILPRVFILRDGIVTAVWSRIPTPDEVLSSLTKSKAVRTVQSGVPSNAL